MNQHFDVIVVGGGIVGLTAALAMAERHFSVAVIDAGTMQAELSKVDPRVYAINQASQELLQNLNVWQELEQTRISPYRKMYVWDAVSGADIEFDSTLVAKDSLGAIIEESVLKKALLECLFEKEQVSFFPNQQVQAIEVNANEIRLNTEDQSWWAKLLMIADGANSTCRQLLKVALTSWSYHQQALVALVSTEKSHQQTAYQVFNPDGPLAFLPLNNAHQCSIVWSTSPSHVKSLMNLPEQNFNQELTKAFATKLGQVTLQGPRQQFPLTMRHAKQYSGNRWILLGDAAHTIHPLAGLGLNVGLADITSWLACLDNNKNSISSKKLLATYQRQRKHAVWQIIAMMDSLKMLFANPLSPVVAMRGLGLRIANNLKPLKKFFITQAAGKIN